MSECNCNHDKFYEDTLIPKVGVVTDIRQETPDVKTFRVVAPDGSKLFEHMPGQWAKQCFPLLPPPQTKNFRNFPLKSAALLQTISMLWK